MAQKFLKLDLALKCLLDNTPRAQEQCWLPPRPICIQGAVRGEMFSFASKKSFICARSKGWGVRYEVRLKSSLLFRLF